MRKSISLVLAVIFMASLAVIPASANTVWNRNTIQNLNGVDYEFWADNGGGTMTIPTSANGAFSCEWNNINNILFRSGRKWNNRNQTHQQIGQITMNYNVSTWNVQGNSYLCIYGWTVDPLVEWYIIETYGTYKPSGNASRLGTVSINGGTYELFRTTRTNQPSILGTRTFDQYWSIRTSNRRSGTVDVSAHFRAWEAVGLRMGNLTEVALTVEGWQNRGNATVSQMSLSVGGGGGGSQPPATQPPATQPPATQPPANNASTRYTFANMSFASNQNASSYSVSNGSLNVNYGGQHREVRYNLPQAINLANCTSIVVNGQSANGQTAIKFFNASGQEVFVMWNNRASSATNWTRNLSAADRNNTITRIGIMSQDTGSYSATINSITFNGVSVGGGSTPPATNPPGTSPPATNPPSTSPPANNATRITAQSMTKGGQWTGNISSPFNGVALYGNNDLVRFNQFFANNRHQFSLRGASSASGNADVRLDIGGTNSGTFRFSGTSPSTQNLTVSHNRGNSTVEIRLVRINDTGPTNALIEWLEIRAA
ncbi:MAG: glycoside hydrolase family 11 protein [Oscillospiraceae bacterium]|nr:glycoside hydrolase family 11 protein [Oscillospiraceae bacterium]